MGKIYQVEVHGLRGEKTIVDLCNTEEQMRSMTVEQLKGKIAQKLPYSGGTSFGRKTCNKHLIKVTEEQNVLEVSRLKYRNVLFRSCSYYRP